MSEIQEALRAAARMGYKAAENGENLEQILNDITVQKEASKA